MNETKYRLYRLKIGHWRLVLANCRLKKMPPAQARRGKSFYKSLIAAKRRRFKQNGGVCEICGRPLAYADAEIHHILPFAEFPQYGTDTSNLEVVCTGCHRDIHHNPYVNLQRMERKALELGIDLPGYYQTKFQNDKERRTT